MKKRNRFISLALTLGLALSVMVTSVSASKFVDAHGNELELDDTLEAYSSVVLSGADNAARKAETNLGDLWTDALRWFAVSGKINAYFDEDDVAAGNTKVDVDADHIVALWNGGNLRADIAVGKFGAAELAAVLPYPNKVAVTYMSGAQLLEALEAAAQALPYGDASADACASLMQAAGLTYSVNADQAYDKGEAYGKHWFKANSVSRVTITDVNGKAFDPNATYAVITHNANFNGMDSSYMFKAAAEANEKSAITKAVVRDVVWMYISEELGNMVGDAYAVPQGRITVTATAAPAESAKPGQSATTTENGTYTVVSGDSLWKIASKVYGSGKLWSKIFSAHPSQDGCAGILIALEQSGPLGTAVLYGNQNHTIARQGQTRLTARLSGAFCSFRLGGRQPTCISKKQKSLENPSLSGADISARQNRVCPCQAMVENEDLSYEP